MTLPTQITATIDPEWIAAEAIRLINIPSVTMDEAAVCVCFGQQLRDLGLDVDIADPGRHDTVPATGHGVGREHSPE